MSLEYLQLKWITTGRTPDWVLVHSSIESIATELLLKNITSKGFDSPQSLSGEVTAPSL